MRPCPQSSPVCRGRCVWGVRGLSRRSGSSGSSVTASRIGHGSGRNLTDPPSIAATSKEVLQKAMIIHVKPKYELDGGVFQIEEVAVVTKDGADPISGLSEEKFPENGI
ncbi:MULTISPECIES: M24 family metallopeptidase [Mesorhizobium]|uniref:M24 family metallopeptidase n=1 Tax=Mesorhizobium TaxID=68287 RepID=UPI00333C58B1